MAKSGHRNRGGDGDRIMARDHGGDIDRAAARHGPGNWLDLSTGINRRPWPVGPVPPEAWQALPTAAAEDDLRRAAAGWFGCAPGRVLPVPGASAAIALIPRLWPAGRAAVLAPSYNEHGAGLRAAGWRVAERAAPADMAGADLAVVVNPNNPDGREWSPAALADLARTVGHLVVDESFADARPDLSLIPALPDNALVLRSFGKFWGLAGLRLGFVIASEALLGPLAAMLGPWAVSGPALHVGALAMADRAWAGDTVARHAVAAPRLDALAADAGWGPVGGTHLFRLYDTPDAAAAQDRLAACRIWTRRFPYSPRWLRLGIPGPAAEWNRLAAALRSA